MARNLTPEQWQALMVLMPRSQGDTHEAMRRVLCDGWTQVKAAEHYALNLRGLQRGLQRARILSDAALTLTAEPGLHHVDTVTEALDALGKQIRHMEQRQPHCRYELGELWAKDKAARDALKQISKETAAAKLEAANANDMLESIGAGGVGKI